VAEALSIDRLAKVLLHHWLLVLVCVLLGLMAGFGATRLITPVYTASATQLVKGVPGTGVAANYEAAQYANSRARSYPSLIYSSSVLENVRTDMGGRESTADLRDDISVENPTDTPILVLSARGTTPQEAQQKADSAARHLARFITQIETVSGKSPITVETAVTAALPLTPTSPRVPLVTALGAISGFALGAIAALFLALRPKRRPRAAREPVGASWWPEDGRARVPVTDGKSPDPAPDVPPLSRDRAAKVL